MVADMIRRYPTIQVDQETVMIVVEDEEEFPLVINAAFLVCPSATDNPRFMLWI